MKGKLTTFEVRKLYPGPFIRYSGPVTILSVGDLIEYKLGDKILHSRPRGFFTPVLILNEEEIYNIPYSDYTEAHNILVNNLSQFTPYAGVFVNYFNVPNTEFKSLSRVEVQPNLAIDDYKQRFGVNPPSLCKRFTFK